MEHPLPQLRALDPQLDRLLEIFAASSRRTAVPFRDTSSLELYALSEILLDSCNSKRTQLEHFNSAAPSFINAFDGDSFKTELIMLWIGLGEDLRKRSSNLIREISEKLLLCDGKTVGRISKALARLRRIRSKYSNSYDKLKKDHLSIPNVCNVSTNEPILVELQNLFEKEARVDALICKLISGN